MQNANSSEIVALIARHQARLRGLVRCLLVRAADVDDLLQEVNSVLWEKACEFEMGTDFWAWASQIARFKALNHIRKYRRQRLVFDDGLLNQIAEAADRRLVELDRRRDALDHCLQQLPPAQRQLIDLRYSGGHAMEVISEMIGRPEGSIRQTLYRIRAALLACIESKIKAEPDAT
jgi:RNA polymerase sigma-70 factor, ECF subfamily